MESISTVAKFIRKLYFDFFLIHSFYLFVCLINASLSDVYIPPFQIIVCLPTETAPHTSRELRRVIAKWESDENNVFYSASDDKTISYHPADIPMFITPLPVANDGYSIIPALCDALEIHNPSIILSLLDAKKSLFSRIISATSWIPVLSITQQYKQNPTIQVNYELKVQ